MTTKQIKSKIETTKKASSKIAVLSVAQRRKVLESLAQALIKNDEKILLANRKDVWRSAKLGLPDSFIERLTLDKEKIKDLAATVQRIAKMPDLIGKILGQRKMPSGIKIKKIRVPLGLVAIIYESRPNVTMDAFCLCFKSGNAVILKGGKEITQTNKALARIIKNTLRRNNISEEIVLDLSGINKEVGQEILNNKLIDCLIPRGGKKLISWVQDQARVPVIITGASVVHIYVASDADLDLARRVVLNAKTRRVSICNALDVLLVNQGVYLKFLAKLAPQLAKKRVTLRADKLSYNFLKQIKYPQLKRAQVKDFDMEFLDYILAIKVVDNLNEALDHISRHTLGHSEAIITRSAAQANKFFATIDAACLYHNTSTQFSDGGEFGLGAEIGISTQKLHARGPFGYESLMTYKYLIDSPGATRK